MIKVQSLSLPYVAYWDWKSVLGVFKVLLILAALALFLTYIFQVNFLVSEKYIIQEYQQNLNRLAAESKSLEMASLEANSLNSVTASLEGLDLERVNKTHYIRVLNTKVVTK